MSNEFPGGERGDGGIPIAGEPADEIVGHKTLMDGTHVPLLRAEARELLAAVDRDKRRRESAMPSERDAIVMMWQAYQRLRELGWREAIYCPKDGTWFQAIEPGSTGQHLCYYDGDWPNGRWTDGDYGLRPCLFKLSPEDEAKRQEKMTEAAERFRQERV